MLKFGLLLTLFYINLRAYNQDYHQTIKQTFDDFSKQKVKSKHVHLAPTLRALKTATITPSNSCCTVVKVLVKETSGSSS